MVEEPGVVVHSSQPIDGGFPVGLIVVGLVVVGALLYFFREAILLRLRFWFGGKIDRFKR